MMLKQRPRAAGLLVWGFRAEDFGTQGLRLRILELGFRVGRFQGYAP